MSGTPRVSRLASSWVPAVFFTNNLLVASFHLAVLYNVVEYRVVECRWLNDHLLVEELALFGLLAGT